MRQRATNVVTGKLVFRPISSLCRVLPRLGGMNVGDGTNAITGMLGIKNASAWIYYTTIWYYMIVLSNIELFEVIIVNVLCWENTPVNTA